MAKYIGTYATSGDVETALNNKELSRPFIAYTTDDDKVYYGVKADKAEVGDIVVYSVADGRLHFIKLADYSASTYPVAEYVPVGVVAYPQFDDPIQGPTGEITFMGLNWLDKNNPDTGNTRAQKLEWGYNNFDVPEMQDYTASSAHNDMNGKANTAAVLQYATAQDDWRTASAITFTNAAGYYPVFECAWRYRTSGTAQGDWFVPSVGQLFIFTDNSNEFQALNQGLSAISQPAFSLTRTYGSTEVSARNSLFFYDNSTRLDNMEKNNTAFINGVRPYCSKLMTRI